MPVTQNRDRPPKAKAFYTYSYNHAHRLALEKLYMELSRSPTDFFNHFWIQVAVAEGKWLNYYKGYDGYM
jgi:hypothetical protein